MAIHKIGRDGFVARKVTFILAGIKSLRRQNNSEII